MTVIHLRNSKDIVNNTRIQKNMNWGKEYKCLVKIE